MHFRRFWIILGIMYIVLIIILSLVRTPDITLPISFTDKIIHFLMYFVLVGWFVQLYQSLPKRLLVLLSAVLLGMGMEYLQGMTDYRSFDYADGIANAIGACCAFSLAKTRFDTILSRIDQWIYQLIKTA